MGILRQKQRRKILQFYSVVFGLRPSYKIILDGSFIHAAVSCKKDVHDSVSKLLNHSDVQLFTCKPVVHELEALGKPFEDAACYAKTALRMLQGGGGGKYRKKKHKDDAEVHEGESPAMKENAVVPADEGVLRFLGQRNAKHYIVATQDVEFRKRLRRIPGVPLIYMNRTVLVLEKPSEASTSFQSQQESKKRDPKKWERQRLHDSYQKTKASSSSTTSSTSSKKRKRGPKGPNPLAIRKKKHATEQPKRTSLTVGGGTAKIEPSSSVVKKDGSTGKKRRRRKRRKSTKESEAQ